MFESFESMLKRAGLLITVGLVVQLLTFLWIDALSFVLFLVVGSVLVGSGVLGFLYWLVMSRS